jgi:phosphinothricin acetyltransferase
VLIRPATAADAEQIAALWNHYIRETTVTFNPQEKSPREVAMLIETRANLGHVTLVAEAADLLGFTSYAQFRAGPGYATCMEHTILLEPRSRGRGAGALLLEAVCQHAKGAGAHQMIAAVTAENQAGLAFHLRHGFAEVARLRDAGRKFDRFIDLVLMQKFL